jgi:hypothetical protein
VEGVIRLDVIHSGKGKKIAGSEEEDAEEEGREDHHGD